MSKSSSKNSEIVNNLDKQIEEDIAGDFKEELNIDLVLQKVYNPKPIKLWIIVSKQEEQIEEQKVEEKEEHKEERKDENKKFQIQSKLP